MGGRLLGVWPGVTRENSLSSAPLLTLRTPSRPLRGPAGQTGQSVSGSVGPGQPKFLQQARSMSFRCYERPQAKIFASAVPALPGSHKK
eukprot:1191265-Prorocentrum_minimum.AAC.5